MYQLGIYNSLYGDTPITAGRALLIAAVGFALVFAVLGLIALFVKAMGSGFDAAAKKKRAKAFTQTPASPAAPAADNQPALPENESAGQLVLTDVTQEEAAMIMAIVSHKSGIPLNRLQFNSIRLLEDKQ